MTSHELARRTGNYDRASLVEKRDYALALSRAGELLPVSLCDTNVRQDNGTIIPRVPNPGKILMMTETGQMLGIHPMAAITQIHIIEGKPALSAALWAALVREAGHQLRVWIEGEGVNLKAVTTLVRRDDPDFTYKVEWSHADAQKANLLGKDNWKKYERSMLKARAITEIIREGAPEVGMGAAYTPEELGADVAESGEPIEMIATPNRDVAPSAQQTPAPIVDEPETRDANTEDPAPDYAKEIKNLGNSDEARALYSQARTRGDLDLKMKIGRKSQTVAEWITEVGRSFKEAERARPEETGAIDDATPEVLVATVEPDEPQAPA